MKFLVTVKLASKTGRISTVEIDIERVEPASYGRVTTEEIKAKQNAALASLLQHALSHAGSV